MNRIFTLILCFGFLTAFSAKPKYQYVKIKTDMGECVIRLYNETPKHRDNFLKLTKEGRYDSLLFHRIIKEFMIQGGDPDSKHAKKGIELGNGDVGYTIPAEFNDSLFHKKGALAAAREDNPEKASSGCQFYIVQGKTYTDEQLDQLETTRLKFKLPVSQRNTYKTIGGTPTLDKRYTVFGEVVSGLEMVDKIADMPKDARDRPLEDIRMSVSILKKRQAKKLEKQLARQRKSELAAANTTQKK